MLGLHLADRDYRVLFDFYEDVVVLEPADNPTTIHFYQVKGTKRGHWTRGQLISRAKGKDGKLPSILGKLLSNQQAFQAETGSLNLVSNARYKLKLNNNENAQSRDNVQLHGLASEELAAIAKAIGEELGVSFSCAMDDITFLHVTSLSLTDHVAHVKGRLVDFLEKVFPDKAPSAQAMYKALLAEVSRKTACEDPPRTFDDLCKHKSLSRSDVAAMMSGATVGETFKEIWATVDNAIRHEGFNISEVATLRVACNTYLLQRMDPTNSLLCDLTEKITAALDAALPNDAPINSIAQLFSAIEAQLAPTGLVGHPAVSHSTWKSITLVIAHEKGKL